MSYSLASPPSEPTMQLYTHTGSCLDLSVDLTVRDSVVLLDARGLRVGSGVGSVIRCAGGFHGAPFDSVVTSRSVRCILSEGERAVSTTPS